MRCLNPDKLHALLQEHTLFDMSDGRIGGTGLCVMQEGREIYKSYNGPVSFATGKPLADCGDSTIFRLASMTKPITTVAALLQVSRGKLELDTPITDLLPQFGDLWVGHMVDGKVAPKERAHRPLTLRLLLNHTSGLGVNHPAVGNQEASLTPDMRSSLSAVVDFWSKSYLGFQPAEAQLYSPTAAFDVVARLVEMTADMPYDEFVRQEITDPVGMTDTTFAPTEEQWSRMIAMHDRRDVDGKGVGIDGSQPACVFENYPVHSFCGGAGLCATLPDYIRFAQFLLHEGVTADGRRILPAEWVREMRTPCVPYEIMPFRERWGLGVRVITIEDHWMPKGCFGWSGAYGSHFWVDPVNQITAVYMKNSRHDGGSGARTSAVFEQDVYACLE